MDTFTSVLSSVQRELPVQPDVMGGVCAAEECGDVERGPVFHSLEHRDSGGCASAGTDSQRTDRMPLWDLHEREPGMLALHVYYKVYFKCQNSKLLLSKVCNTSLTKDVLLLSLQQTQME